MKGELKKLHKEEFKSITEKIEVLRSHLDEVQTHLQSADSTELHQEEKQISMELKVVH
jgi:transcription elongation GreA/GreB family factor